jgi:hypothetical protein
MDSPARDQAIRFACDLFHILFRRLWLPFGEREITIITKLIDLLIAAVAECIGPDRAADDDLDALADDAPPFPLQNEYTTVRLPRREVER